MRQFVTLSIIATSLTISAQTLFTEDFENSPAFTLNTTDANSTVGIANTWLVNNIYAGGNGVADCLGFPLDFSIGATAGQPVGITTPNGNYLHTASTVAISNGIQCCSFGAADGFCTDADDIFSGMNTDVSTLGSTDVSLKFWWLCSGGTQYYGEVWYSLNSGGSWTQLTTPIAQYRNQTNWSEQTATIPAFGNQPTLRFGFRFHNGQSLAGGTDPGFAIDDVRIIASSASTIATGGLGSAFCQGTSFNVPYTINGSFNAGNVFSAQLSDATGGFGAPVVIGSVSSTTAGTITCQIPFITPPGNGYRIRVVSSNPSVIGADNGVNISVNEAPNAGTNSTLSACSGDDPVAMDLGGDSNGTWSGPSSVINDTYDPSIMSPGIYTYSVPGVGSCPPDQATLEVTEIAGPNAGTSEVAVICKNTGLYELFDFLTGSPDLGGTWTGPGGLPFAGTFNSDNGTPGIYTYTVDPGGPCPNDEAVVTVQLGEPGVAGSDAEWSVCSSELPVDLFSMLVDANSTGIWFNSSGDPFNGNTSEGGVYTYIDFAQQPCSNDTAVINLIVQEAAYAGENGTATLCTNGPLQALTDLLGGLPQASGTWTDPNNVVISGILNPAIAVSGLYTYTVQGIAPCASDEALLAVVIDPCTGIGSIVANDFQLNWIASGAEGYALFTSPDLNNATLTIIDAAGRSMRSWNGISSRGRLAVDVRDLSSGLYGLRVQDGVREAMVRFLH
ncbi:MAG: hypothetical protein IPP33_01845 [Flavobacteriales bacterium]|nr:hypothetical protein [Flavobacteriales bacterium]